MTRETLAVELVRRQLRCDAAAGKLYWLPRPREMFQDERMYLSWTARRSGKEAFTAFSKGYRTGALDGRMVKAHRVLWAHVHGEWPAGQLDHINGDRADNRLCNLRLVTNQQNQFNRKCRSDNRLGHRGITFESGRYRVRIVKFKGGPTSLIGRFDTFEEASAAYRAAAIEIHGDFYRDPRKLVLEVAGL